MIKSFLKLAGLLSMLMAVFLLSSVKPALADASDNIRGLAYNSLYGYISFNCLDDDFAGRFPFTFPFVFNIYPCSISNHGVNLDSNNNFSGDAWNLFLGTITFTSAIPTPDGGSFRTNCETSVATSTACYREADRKVYGYMRVLSTGEWINLDDNTVPPTVGITRYDDPQPGIFSGYASSTFGSISMNCTNDGSCATNNYNVKIGPLEIRQMTAPNWDSSAACLGGARQTYLKWNRRSGTQTAFEIIISTANSTSTGLIYDSGKVLSTAVQHPYTLPSYDTPYYWFLRLWDETDTAISWRQFNTSGTKDWITDNFVRNSQKNLIDPTKTFTSYKHEFPRPSFTWSPTDIVVATSSNSFVSNSNYYNDSNTLQACTGATCTFKWSTSDLLATISNDTMASTSIIFTKATNTSITLTATNDSIYICSTSTILDVNYALPLWKETKAP